MNTKQIKYHIKKSLIRFGAFFRARNEQLALILFIIPLIIKSQSTAFINDELIGNNISNNFSSSNITQNPALQIDTNIIGISIKNDYCISNLNSFNVFAAYHLNSNTYIKSTGSYTGFDSFNSINSSFGISKKIGEKIYMGVKMKYCLFNYNNEFHQNILTPSIGYFHILTTKLKYGITYDNLFSFTAAHSLWQLKGGTTYSIKPNTSLIIEFEKTELFTTYLSFSVFHSIKDRLAVYFECSSSNIPFAAYLNLYLKHFDIQYSTSFHKYLGVSSQLTFIKQL